MEILLFMMIGVVLLIAGVAVLLALMVVFKNSKVQKNSPELVVQAKVLRSYAQEQSVYSVDSINEHTNSTYYVEFMVTNKTKLKFKVKKKTFLTLNDGDKGTLVYKGNKMIRFDKMQ